MVLGFNRSVHFTNILPTWHALEMGLGTLMLLEIADACFAAPSVLGGSEETQGVQADVLLVTRILNGRLAAIIFTELYVDDKEISVDPCHLVPKTKQQHCISDEVFPVLANRACDKCDFMREKKLIQNIRSKQKGSLR